jgi:uncharacterized coiled-coil protein SlyX
MFMSNLLRVLIVLLLVLGIAALVLELSLFSQREELKGRNLLLARGTVRVAETIESPEGTPELLDRSAPRMKIAEDQLKQFYQADAAGRPVKDPATGKKLVTGPGTLDGVLNELAGKAAVQVGRLNDLRDALEQDRTTLAKTKETLAETEQNLGTAKQDIKQKDETIAAQTTDLEQKKEQIGELQEKTRTLTDKAEEQTAQLAQLNEKLTDKDSELDATKNYVKKLEKELAIVRRGGGDGGSNAPPPGIQGQILAVNDRWNFVVMDVLPQGHMYPLTDLTVQRDSQLIGKVRVSEVLTEQNFAVGEILRDWQQTPVAVGDYVFY